MKVRYLNQQDEPDLMNNAVITESAELTALLGSKRNKNPFVGQLLGDDIEFFSGGTASPIPARNIINFDELKEIAQHFLKMGERSPTPHWEPV